MIEHVEPNKTVGGEWRLSSARFPTVSAVSKVAMHLKFEILLFQDIKFYSALCTVSNLLTLIFRPIIIKQHPKIKKHCVFKIKIFLRPASSRTSWENMSGK